MTDNELKEQFLDILGNNIGIIIKISKAYTQVRQDREDLINDIVLELWKSFGRFEGNSKISTWIYRVALNVSMNYKRKKKNDPLFSSADSLMDKDVFAWLITEQEDPSGLEMLYDCIDKLNEINKAIILLYLDGNSHDDISEIMGISKTNVGTRIGRIKEQLRNLINSKT
ncbi:RNA polymerase sigma factor [Dysgonomonas sp. OttesenSCG-928-M03]|nr:RNA polymerase sigma factor [Dysgonomonas sp. OttesenSCG-928-M03]